MLFFNEISLRSVGRLSAVCALVLAGQGFTYAQSAPTTPTALLKWSMGKYAELPSFQADCSWSLSYPNLPTPQASKRTIVYEKPNHFKIVSTLAAGQMIQTSVSDGKKVVEFTTGLNQSAMSYEAPSSIANAQTMMMGMPMFCGSLLYKFFGGPDKYSALVDTAKMPVSFGPTATLDGQPCRTVNFWAQGTYGKTTVYIGTTDGLVHRIRYGSEPLMQMMRSQATKARMAELTKSKSAAEKKSMEKAMKNLPTSMLTTENYVHIATGATIDPTVFVAKVPEGISVQEMGGGSEPQPPVALGSPAPDISVTGADGVKRTLADFKGKVVLIDFWATWCPPCRKGLPETQKFYTEYADKGLAVLTVSDEKKATVDPFIKENKYTFPVYLDTDGATNKTYKITAIPTVVVIDKEGKLVAYKVGLSPREEILAELKKAGL